MSTHVFYPSSFPVDPETTSVTRSKVQHYLNVKDGFVLTGGGCFRGATGGGLARGVVLMVIGGASVPVGVVGGLLTVDRLLSFSRTGNGGGVSSDSGSIVEGITFLYGGLPGEKDKRPPGGSDLLVLTGRGGGEGERSFTFEVSPFVTSEEGGIVSGGTAAGPGLGSSCTCSLSELAGLEELPLELKLELPWLDVELVEVGRGLGGRTGGELVGISSKSKRDEEFPIPLSLVS